LFIAASATDRWRVVILSLPVSHQQQAIFNLVTINLATINLGRRRWPENRRRRSTIPAPSDQFIPARSCLPDHSHPVIHTRLFIPVPSRSGRQSRHLRTVTKALD
jgi:hypothetical protein